MPLLRLYYELKPYLPMSMRLALRRWLMRRQRHRVGDVWPINPAGEGRPADWKGWPEGKRFAFVVTHDVEGQRGLDRCRELALLDESCGFVSSFNFVPEGEYETPPELRQWLVSRGFEVGVHDLRHDGKLYQSREVFRANAERINTYLEAWNAVGFRSGFMHHNFEWLHDLHVLYDASGFDTDPFEPQPDGVNTIFPYWEAKPESGTGYVQLPYTLAQDSTMFLFLQESSPALWEQKLAWIAERGGMALLNVHPDYMSLRGQKRNHEYDAGLYRSFLEGVRTKYKGEYWNALPKTVAEFCRRGRATKVAGGGAADGSDTRNGRATGRQAASAKVKAG